MFLNGCMDHWVPSAEAVSGFWKTPLPTICADFSRLFSEIAFNNVTFYTKWYTNGYRSGLPFLFNHRQAENVRTNNEWGREIIELLHARGMTAGAMIQSYSYLPGAFPSEHTLGVWSNTRLCTGEAEDNVIVDPLWPAFTSHFEEMLEEHLRIFPGFDAMFLEFEGLTGAEPKHHLAKMGEGAPVGREVQEQWRDSGWEISPRDRWIWTEVVQNILRESLRAHLAVAERVFNRMNYRGIRGVVYHAMNYETPYLSSCLPSKDWWLLPWHYWGWDFAAGTPDNVRRRQIHWCQEQFRARIREGHSLCYIGNATLPTECPETIREMADFCRVSGASGHLGMGIPLPGYGLRWHKATEDTVASSRRLYRELFPK